MHNLKDEIVSAPDIAKEFRLSDEVAREIVAEETQRALKGNWQAWVLLLSGFLVAGLIYFSNNGNRTSAIFIMLFTGVSWTFVGRYLARSKIRDRARAKSERIHGQNS